jgi:hypothetical protein
MSADSVYIAGWKTPDEWRAFRATLVVGADPGRWHAAFADYFQTRLRLRYLNPIRILQENGTFQGEGFSILVIQCSLIEFLESTVQGLTYRHPRQGEKLGPHEYSASGALFRNFLCQRQPFAAQFDQQLADDFYVGVRCGLLHEARTKNGWRVWAVGPAAQLVDRARKIVYRDNFQTALADFIAWYGAALQSDPDLQAAFIRKFDSLCE